MSFNIAILLSVEILPTEIKEPVCKKTFIFDLWNNIDKNYGYHYMII